MESVYSKETVLLEKKIKIAGEEIASIIVNIENAEKSGDLVRVAELNRQLEGRRRIFKGDKPYF